MNLAGKAIMSFWCCVLWALPVGAACPTADLNGDCRVNLADFSALSAQWLLAYGQEDLTQIGLQWCMEQERPDGIKFAAIPAGAFQMGDSFTEGAKNERPVHSVTLSPFKISKHEVTNSQYAQFLNAALTQGTLKEVNGVIYASTDSSNSQPWFSTSSAPAGSPHFGQYSQIVSGSGNYSVRARDDRPQDSHPVVCVSWYGAKAFCDFYGYKLPTEAQWEYAARGNLTGQRFPWGDIINHNLANYYSNAGDSYDNSLTHGYHPAYNTGVYPYTAPVGSFNANGFGLFDMAGNAMEWCADRYGSYPSDPQSDPTGPASGLFLAARGGAWSGYGGSCRVSYRSGSTPETRNYYFGFRVCQP